MIPRVRVVIRIGRGTPQSRAVGLSAAAHVVFAVAAVTLPGLRAQPAAPLPTLDVTLMGPLADVPAPAPARAPATPPPQPEPESVPEKPEGPSVTPQDTPKPVEKKVEKPKTEKPKPKPEPAKPAPPVATPSAGEEAADEPGGTGSAPAGPIAAPDGGALAGMGAEFDWYRDAVIRALYAAWRRPFAAGVTESQEVAVAFEIRRDGSVGAVQILQSSGNPSLDRSALRAVQEAALPPLPRNYSRATQPARFVFRLDPESY